MATYNSGLAVIKLLSEGWLNLDSSESDKEIRFGGPVYMLSPTGAIAKVDSDGKIWIMEVEDWAKKATLKEGDTLKDGLKEKSEPSSPKM